MEQVQELNTLLTNGSIDEYCKKIMCSLKICQKLSMDLQGWHHYSDYSGVQYTMSRINTLLYNLISKIFNHQDIKLEIEGYKLLDQFDIIREGNDALLEKINSDLDEAGGLTRNDNIEILDSTIRTIRGPIGASQNQGREMVLIASRNVQKPQLFFDPKINNSDKEPFIPVIKEKANSMKPLSVLVCIDSDNREYYSHPYEYELQHWNVPEKLLQKTDPIPAKEYSSTPFTLVETVEVLHNIVKELKECTEIAIDVEHHSFRSYQGLTCLIQISSREKDYIIDPFPLRNELPILNEIFTDPKITKVFHGADYDILWLQRDCGVYVVNMFDTHQAAIVLEYPHRSLASLLQRFCSILANKSYQRADWRIRPLPEDFIEYARKDTHYLLYIYDVMKNELIDRGNELNNLINAVYTRSTDLCLKRYEKPIVGPDSHLDLYRKSMKHFDCRQMYALKEIYLWRDKMARQQDESVHYVLPNHMMMRMAEVLPKEMQGILACCNPVPALVKTEQLTLHQIIRAARNLPIEEVKANVEAMQSGPMGQVVDVVDDASSSLVCRFDLSLVEEDPPGLASLLNPQETLLGDLFSRVPVCVRTKVVSSLFGVTKEQLNRDRDHLGAITTKFLSPFERYKAYLAMKQDEEARPPDPAPAPSLDEQRVQNIRAHFLSLNTSNDAADKLRQEEEADQERLGRLQNHIATLSFDGTSGSKKAPKKKRQKLSINEKIQKNRDKQLEKKKNEDAQTQSLKRKSTDGDDSLVKKLKSENKEETEDRQDGEKGLAKGKKENKEEGREDVEKSSVKNLKNNDKDEEEFEDGELREDDEATEKPFDYSQADFSIFGQKKMQRKMKGRQIQENFRGKGSWRGKKSGWKSYSYVGRSSKGK